MKTGIFRYIILPLTMAMAAAEVAAAQDSEFPWLRLPSGGASLAMADAGMLSDDNVAWSAFGASAMTVLSDKEFAAAVAYSVWNPAPYGRVSAGLSAKTGDKVALSCGISHFSGGEYTVYDTGAQAVGTFTPAMLRASFGFGLRLSGALSMGANLHYARESAAENAGYSALAGDLMAAFRHDAFRAGAGLCSIGKSLDGGRMKDFPASFKMSAGYDRMTSGGRFPIAVYADADCYFGGAVSAAAGVSMGFKGVVSLRCGYRYSSKTAPLPSFGTIGGGFDLCGIGLDAAYVIASDAVGGSFQAGLRYSF